MNTWGEGVKQKKEKHRLCTHLGSGRPSDMIQNMGVQKKIYIVDKIHDIS